MAAIGVMLAGVAAGFGVGWVTPVFLNPVVEPDATGAVVLLLTLLVVTPLLGYAEMMVYWTRSRFRRDLYWVQHSPQAGMGAIAPGAMGLALGLVLGWSAPFWVG